MTNEKTRLIKEIRVVAAPSEFTDGMVIDTQIFIAVPGRKMEIVTLRHESWMEDITSYFDILWPHLGAQLKKEIDAYVKRSGRKAEHLRQGVCPTCGRDG